jgi:hypothetical protein
MECKKKGYLKIHVVSVDIRKKKIVSLDVTSQEVDDGSRLKKKMIDNASENNNTLKRVIADGAYDDSKENFQYLSDNDIEASIKVRKKLYI